MIKALYICGDVIGAPGGAGSVTRHELNVLQSIYGSDQVQVFQLDDVRPGPYAGLDVPFIHDRFALSKVARLCEKQGFPKHCHIYSGSYSELTRYLVDHDVKVSHTSPSHDRNLSMKERGPTYYLPHIDIPELWEQHKAGLLMADLVIVPGEAPRRFLESEGVKPERMVVIPHGIESMPDHVAPFPEEFTVGYLGASGPDKGVKYLIDAWATLGWTDARLIIAGEGSQQWGPYIQSRAGKGRFALLGYVPDIAAFFDTLTVYVQPSISEGFGIEVIEAMSYGRPVIASTGAGAADAVPPAWRVPPGDSQALANTIHDIRYLALMDKDGFKHMGDGRRERTKDYLWEKIRLKYIDVFRELLRGH